jgi:DNA-binding transcriptional regulator GbsR (MarR family)
MAILVGGDFNMSSKKAIKTYLKANPEFSAWLREQPESIKQLQKNPADIEEMIISWNREQNRKQLAEKSKATYHQLVDQMKELHVLLQRVDDLVHNVKSMSSSIQKPRIKKMDPPMKKGKKK